MKLDKKIGNVIIDGLINNMVYVEGGKFLMGSNSYADYDVRPWHNVSLSSFYIGKFQVIQKEWLEIMGNNPSEFINPYNPVENVSWFDCEQFFSKLNSRTGMNFYFPTEAQWEFAANGGNKPITSRDYPFPGSDSLSAVGWYYYNSGETIKVLVTEETFFKKATYREKIINNRPHQVGQLKSNQLGIYDMAGNVQEWCSDWYEEYSSGDTYNPKGGLNGVCKVLRGGSFSFGRSICASTYRGQFKPHVSDDTVGLRIALNI